MMREKYSVPSITFHWAHALIVVFLVCWGSWMADLPKGPERGEAFALHKSIGMVAFLLLLVRASWRFFHRPPPPIIDSFYIKKLSIIIHRCLYLLLAVVPMMGYMSASFTKYDMKFFGFPLPKTGWFDPQINEIFSQIHGFLAWTLVGFFIVHIVGAVIHKKTIKRMLF